MAGFQALTDGRFSAPADIVCPNCGESQSALNPQENLVRCFHCQTNFNPIDFTMAARDCDFVEAVEYLLSLVDTT